MRRIAALFLCLIILAFASGCKDRNASASHDVDIPYFTDMGALPECELKLGDSLPDLEKEENAGYMSFSDSKPPYISDGSFSFYYDAASEEKTVTKIAAFNTAFGFETGDIVIEITDALDGQSVEYAERDPHDGELFFLPAGNNRSVVECKSLKTPLLFVFEENALCAVLLG